MDLKEKILKRCRRDESGCLIWTGALVRKKYGHIQNIKTGKRVYTHRAIWENENGPIPRGYFICHKCDVPACCEINHLFLGTPKENTADMWGKKRGHCGERAVQAKLTLEQVLLIKSDPRGHTALAREFGVTKHCIWMIRRGRSWRRATAAEAA